MQPAGQMVDLGNGYKAFVKTPGMSQIANVMTGAAGAGGQAALQQYFRKQDLADREQVAGQDFNRRLDFLDKEYGYRGNEADADQGRRLAAMDKEFSLRERGADTDQVRRFDELGYRANLGEQGAVSDQARRDAAMEKEFSLRERGAESDQARRMSMYGVESADKVGEALAAAGVAPSAFGGDRAKGLDALAGRYASDGKGDAAMQQAVGIAKLVQSGMSLDEAKQIFGVGGTAGAGMAGANPSNPELDALQMTAKRQERLLQQVEAMKRKDARGKDAALSSNPILPSYYH